MKFFTKFIICAFKLLCLIQIVVSNQTIQFNRSVTGVEFSAYIKTPDETPKTNWKSYTLDDMKTMLRVISGRFSRINTYGVGADNVEYVENKTYSESNAQVMTAEAAALINQERGSTSLTIIVGIFQSQDYIAIQDETEIKVAFESAQIANSIYPGTVEGFVLSHHEIGKDVKRARATLEFLEMIQNQSIELGLKIGSRQTCTGLTARPDESDTLLNLRQKILRISDFIICETEPAPHNVKAGAKSAFSTIQNDLLGYRKVFKKINPNLEVMGQTKWASKGSNSWDNIDKFRDFWVEADRFASQYNFQMWMHEAIDNPWKTWTPQASNYGWWKLRGNDVIDNMDGYAEKIFEPPEEPTTNHSDTDKMPTTEPNGMSPWVYVGIGIGVIVLIFVISLIALLFMRVNMLQVALTKDDIREFMYGVSEEVAAQQGSIESALKFPYDKSFEISKEKLKIRSEHLLGTGQFGCVYKAQLEDDEKTEVALKMAKHDCPKSALKGLLSEIKILTYLGKHPNIVSIHGAYTAELINGVVYVATELCTLGSLESYLRNCQTGVNQDRYANAPQLQGTYANENSTQITFKEMIRWSHEIACGMEYLGTKHVVHADLATRNVLLAADRTAKITDFGLSRRLYDYTNYVKQQQEPLPWRWMAIESLKRLEFSSKSDVWSYGVTLWEIFALGDLPYPGLSWNLEFVDNLVNGLRMKSPPQATPQVYEIMVDCWHMEPKDRPTFTDLKLTTSDIFTAGVSSATPTTAVYDILPEARPVEI